MALPSALLALARHCREQGIRFPGLRWLQTNGEALDEATRNVCREAWGLGIADVYSAEETGHLALQCPEFEHYHVQSEAALVEVLDANGRPCRAGEVGQVAATPLHNFAMPLIRYALGDWAEIGDPCPCGRGLPVLRRILGRTRNLLTLPSGEKRYAVYGTLIFGSHPDVLQFQIVQKNLADLEVKLVVKRKLEESELAQIRDQLVGRIGHPFRIEFSYHDEIPRAPSGKFEEFQSFVS